MIVPHRSSRCSRWHRYLALAVATLVCGCGAQSSTFAVVPILAAHAGPLDVAHFAEPLPPAQEEEKRAEAPPEVAPPRARNVLLVVVDTLRADRLSCYGYERRSPHIDALAARGTLYLESRSQGSWTRPSMQSLMSGRYLDGEYARPTAKVPLLAEVLSEAGVETAAFVANPVLGVDSGLKRGFDRYGVDPTGQVHSDYVTWQFQTWLDARQDERPWFAWVHYMDPHHPYAPDEANNPYRRAGTRPNMSALRTRWLAAWEELRDLGDDASLAAEPLEVSMRAMVDGSNAYDGEVLAVDRSIGVLVELLEQRELLDNTLIIFTADHGEMLWEYRDYPLDIEQVRAAGGGLPHGVRSLFANGHTGWLWDPIWHTPLIVVGPGFAAGARIGGLAANVDIHPTVLAALGVEPAGGLDGHALQGSAPPQRELVFGFGRGTTAVADSAGWRLLMHGTARFAEGKPTRELLRPQPMHEAPRNVAAKFAPQVARLGAAVRDWRATLTFDGERGSSAEQRRVLEKLGYVDPDGEAPGNADGGEVKEGQDSKDQQPTPRPREEHR